MKKMLGLMLFYCPIAMAMSIEECEGFLDNSVMINELIKEASHELKISNLPSCTGILVQLVEGGFEYQVRTDDLYPQVCSRDGYDGYLCSDVCKKEGNKYFNFRICCYY